jgi:hypothetical protein
MQSPRYPSLYQINTRVWLTALSRTLDRPERTRGIAAQPFWPKAIQRVRERVRDSCFMAEVYWDLEWTLQQQGFDYAYDKRLYDRLREGHARPVREHFHAGLNYQDKLARFLENHDEPRAAATFAPGQHAAAAVLTFFSLIAVNYCAHHSQCYVQLSFPGLGGGQWLLQDLLGEARYERDGDNLQSGGLYLNVAPWQCHAFEMSLA